MFEDPCKVEKRNYIKYVNAGISILHIWALYAYENT